MTVLTRRLSVALLAAIVGLTVVGCDAATLAYFFMPEAREPAKIKSLASEDPKQTPKVAILAWSALETRSEFIHADRQLADLLGAQLRDLANDNEEKLTILPTRKVEQYKNTHPHWRVKDLAEVASALEVDYLIYLEINSMSLYEPKSANQLFRGRADLNVTLVDAKHPDDRPQEPFTCVYPEARGPVPAGVDTSPAEFRLAFLTHAAKRLSYFFSRYNKHDTSFTE